MSVFASNLAAYAAEGGVSDPAAIPYENHTRNIEAFLHAIENNQPFTIDGHEARKAVELILRIYGR